MMAKIVLITGCSQGGIGHALAKEFHHKGLSVVATARNQESMSELREMGLLTLTLDVTSEMSIKSCVAEVLERCGRVDILVNNAGVSFAGPIAEVPLEKVRNLYETNVFGALALTQAVFSSMASQKQGKIINIGSVASLVHRPWGFPYSSSKVVMTVASNCMRMEMKPFGIQVMLVLPGAISTKIFGKFERTFPGLCPNSWYKPYESAMKNLSSEYVQGDSMLTPVDAFAKEVVGKALRRKLPWRLLYGHHSKLAFFLSLLPMQLKDAILWFKYGKRQ